MLNRPLAVLRNLAFLAAIPWGIETAEAQGFSPVGANTPPAKSAVDNLFPPQLPPVETYFPGRAAAGLDGASPQPAESPATVACPACPGTAPPPRWWCFWDRRHGGCSGQVDGSGGGPVPLGASINTAMATQIQNGAAARMMLYHFDFDPGKAQLTPRGQRQLSKIARWLPTGAAPVLIQPTGVTALDAARRALVRAQLARFSFPVPEERVRTAVPPVRELDGVDAILIEQKLQSLASPAQPVSGAGATSSPSNAAPAGRR
jgi:hypothetical protein